MTEGSKQRSLARLQDLEVRSYTLTTRSHLRVGAGEGSADVAVENPIIRALVYSSDGNEDRVPYLPGSSLHGVVRAWVEKALRSGQAPLDAAALQAHMAVLQESDQKELLENVDREIADFLDKASLEEQERYAHWHVYTDPHVCNPLSDVDKCERIIQREVNPRRWKLAWWEEIGRELPCDVCSIFGYMGQRGRVKFTHAWPTVETVPLDIITRVAINRLTGAADEGKLFDLEAIPPGVTFHFFTVLENLTDEQKAHFDMGVRALNLQLAALGAHSTVGFGMVDLERDFTAKVKRTVFDISETAWADLIAEQESGEASADLTRWPAFFRALIRAHAANRNTLLDGKITLT
jgi:CRISPR/Cas system CSM-associated protein Csm3 (group 7 of RAMP superfamily)